MPKYYTPKRPAIGFANTGSAFQRVAVQRAEPILEYVSDKATLDIDFSGVPRFPRKYPLGPSGVLWLPLQFPLMAPTDPGMSASFVRYSWQPKSSLLQAEQMGIYDLTGEVEATASTSASTTSSQIVISSQSGTVVLETSASFVAQWNIYASGTEAIDSQVSQTLYYSKTSVSGSSTLTLHDIWKFLPGIDDLVANPPKTSPSASILAAPKLADGITTAAAYKQRVGTVATVVGNVITVEDWPTYLTSTATSSLASALAANLVYLGSVTSSVTGVSFSGTTASLYLSLMTGNPSTGSAAYIHSWIPLEDPVSGTYINHTVYDPHAFPISITRSGRVRDVRAWVEFVHDFRSASQFTGSADTADWGLQGIQVAVRSPNVNFLSAHPLWNGSPNLPLRTDPTLTGTGNVFGGFYYRVPELLRSSYLLWQGHGCDDGLRDSLSSNPANVSTFYHEFDRDIDMRTIFWDGSPTANPRELTALYPSATYNSTGSLVRPYVFLTSSLSSGLYPSPTAGAMQVINPVLASPVLTHSLTCSDVPWMLDTRLNLGALEAVNARTAVSLLSAIPLAGWLNGSGGMLPWTQVNKQTVGNGSRFMVRPTASDGNGGLIYAFEGKTSLGDTDAVDYYSWEGSPINRSFRVDSGNLGTTFLPVVLDGESVTYFSVATGSAATASLSKERVIVIGGQNLGITGTATSSVYVGYWASGSNNISWSQATPLPTGVALHQAYYHNEKIYVSPGRKNSATNVKFSGVFISSIDQQSGQPGAWTEIDFSSDPVVSFTKIVAVGFTVTNGNTGSISTDGTTFTNISPPIAPTQSLYGVASNGSSSFVAVSAITGGYWFSNDYGATWTSGVLAAGETFRNVCFCLGSSKWIAVGSSIYTSSNGTSWSQVVSSATLRDQSLTGALPAEQTLFYSSIFTTSSLSQTLTASGFYPIEASSKLMNISASYAYNRPSGSVVNLRVGLAYSTNSGTSWTQFASSSANYTGTSGATQSFNINFSASDLHVPNWDDVRISISCSISNPSGSETYFKLDNIYATTPVDSFTLFDVAAATTVDTNRVQAVGASLTTKYQGTRASWYSSDGGATWNHSRIGANSGSGPTVPEDGILWLAVAWDTGSSGFKMVGSSSFGLSAGYAAGFSSSIVRYDSSTGYTGPALGRNLAIGNPPGSARRIVAVGGKTASYSDDGTSWNNVVLPGNISLQDVIWIGNRFVGVGGDISPVAGAYSADGATWTQNTNGGPWNALAYGTGSTTASLGLPMYSFFDTVQDGTGSNRAFMWTTYVSGAIPTTVRSELLPSSATVPVNDQGIQEMWRGDLSGSQILPWTLPTVVDETHRAWTVGVQAFGVTTKESQIVWDEANGRANMRVPRAEGYSDSLDSEAALSGSTVILSGVFVAGRHGPTLFDSIFEATYLHGPAPATNEFNTLGYQVGPASIRPTYPMLDDIYAYKLTDQVPGTGSFQLASNRPQLVGFRPGLRGTEAAGTWNFLFGTAATHSFSTSSGYAPGPGRGVWVRQVRLETIIDNNQPIFFQNPARARLFGRPSIVPSPDGPRLSSVQSGSSAWDIGLVAIQTVQSPDYGRTVSITSDLNASADAFAVQTFITGNLYNRLLASGVVGPSSPQPSWFLGGNGFGTPYIPDSSMSLGTGSAEQIDAVAAQALLNQTVNIQTLVPGANDLVSYQNRQGYTKTTLQRWEESIASLPVSGTPGASSSGTSMTSTSVSVPQTTSAVELMPVRTNRRGGSIFNNATASLYISLGGVPTPTSFTANIFADGFYELPVGWVGQVQGVWAASGTGSAEITEIY